MRRAAGSPWVHSSPSHCCWVTISKIKGRSLFLQGKIIGSPEVGMRTRSLSGWPENSIGAWAASEKEEKREEKKKRQSRCKRREVNCLLALLPELLRQHNKLVQPWRWSMGTLWSWSSWEVPLDGNDVFTRAKVRGRFTRQTFGRNYCRSGAMTGGKGPTELICSLLRSSF